MRKINAYWWIKPVWTAGTKANRIKLINDACFIVNGKEYWIPAGYECDGASIPRAFWWVPGIGTPTEGFNALGAWGHDPLFLTHALSFEEANEVAYQLWLDAGKRKWAAKTMWAAVASPAGRLAWRNDAADAEELARIRNELKHRPDKEKFDNLWFVQQNLPIAA
jgi:hypothetical protein